MLRLGLLTLQWVLYISLVPAIPKHICTVVYIRFSSLENTKLKTPRQKEHPCFQWFYLFALRQVIRKSMRDGGGGGCWRVSSSLHSASILWWGRQREVHLGLTLNRKIQRVGSDSHSHWLYIYDVDWKAFLPSGPFLRSFSQGTWPEAWVGTYLQPCVFYLSKLWPAFSYGGKALHVSSQML